MKAFNPYQLAYNAGWRAGMAGTSYKANPYRWLLGYCWDSGWCRGVTDYIAKGVSHNVL